MGKQRYKGQFINKYLKKHPKLTVIWVDKCVGSAMNIPWIYSDQGEDEKAVIDLKYNLRTLIRGRLCFIVETVYRGMLDFKEAEGTYSECREWVGDNI